MWFPYRYLSYFNVLRTCGRISELFALFLIIYCILPSCIAGETRTTATEIHTTQKITSSEDAFGDAVAISSEWALISGKGAFVRVYHFNSTLFKWIEHQTIGGEDEFGSSVAISDSGWAIIGSPNGPDGIAQFYCLNRETLMWYEYQKFTGDGDFGSYVSLSNSSWASIGADSNNYVKIYHFDPVLALWSQSQELSGSRVQFSEMGWAIHGSFDSNYAKFYRLNTTLDQWSEEQSYSDTNFFGRPVAISHSQWALAGAFKMSYSPVYFYRYSNLLGNWSIHQIVYGMQTFGSSLASGTCFAVIGMQSRYFGQTSKWYAFNSTSSMWFEKRALSDAFCVAISDSGWVLTGERDLQKAVFYGFGCPAGTCDSGKCDVCNHCSAGTYSKLYSNGKRACLKCPPNTYSDESASECKDCGSGSGLLCIVATPWAGYNTGGTIVTLSGPYFVTESVENVQVRFHNATNTWLLSSQIINDNSLNITTPAVEGIGWVDIDINTNGTWVRLSKFLFYLPPLPSQLAPRSGPIGGSTIITITGSHLDSVGQAWCRFEASGYDSKEVSATLSGDNVLQCTTPTFSAATNTTVSITLNQQQYTIAGWFQYYDVSVTSVMPNWGPSTGSTVIAIGCSRFVDTGDTIKVKMTNEDAGGSLNQVLTGYLWTEAARILFSVPDLSGYSFSLPYQDKIRLFVSMNGQIDQFTSTFVFFSLYDNSYTISPSGIVPNCGPADGTTFTTISGSGFTNTGEIRVNVMTASGSNITAAATFQSSTTLQAVLPAGGVPGESKVSVALNGQQFTVSRPFTYYQVSSISPSFGPMTGNTEVTVTGVGFFGTAEQVKCRFGTMTPVSPVSFTSTQIKCKSPVSSTEETVAVEVTANGADYTKSNVISFKYYHVPNISSILPSYSYDYGGIQVIITGGPFFASSSLTVAFHDPSDSWEKVVSGSNVQFLSSTTIQCKVPSVVSLNLNFPHIVHVFVRMNGQLTGQSIGQIEFTYLTSKERTVSSLIPSMSPNTGETNITVIGSQFGTPGQTISCLFAKNTLSTITTGTILSDTKIQCPVPDMSSWMNAPSVVGVSVEQKNTTLSQFSPSLNLTLYRIPRLNFLSVTSSYSNGNVTTEIHGDNFTSSQWLECRFGDPITDASSVRSVATFISANKIICSVPPHPLSDSRITNVLVFLTINGQDYHPFDHTKALVFSYLPCPAGQYSQIYSDPCMPCAAGHYNPDEAAITCLECHINHYCPGGSDRVTPCPANTISPIRSGAKTDCQCRGNYYQPQGLKGLDCLPCPSGAYCNGGTQRPYAMEAYWNSGSLNDFQFYRCPAGNLSCAGGSNNTLECRSGYTGRMCSQCTTQFYKLEDICLKCPENSEDTIVLSVFIFLALIYVLKRFGGMQGGGGSLSVSVAYVQITALFADFRLQWTEPILDFLSRLTAVNFSIDIASPECSLENWGYAERFGFTMLLPVIALVVIAIFHCISVVYWKIAKRKESDSSKSRWYKWLTSTTSPSESLSASINALLMTLSLLYVILGSTALEPFDCTKLNANEYFLDAYPEMECWKGEHIQIIPWAIACTVLYVVGIPVLFLTILFLNRKQVRDTDEVGFHRKAGVLFKKYHPKWYWWEAVIMFRKLLLVSIKLNLTNYPLIQGALGQFVLLIALVIQFYARPFARQSLDRLESALLTCNFIVLFAGMMFLSDKFDPPELKNTVTAITMIVLAASIVCVLFFLGYELLLAYRSFRFKKREFSESEIYRFWKRYIPVNQLSLLWSWMYTHNTSIEQEPMKRAIKRVLDDSIAPNIVEIVEAVMLISHDCPEHQKLTELVFSAYNEPELQPFVELIQWMKENSEFSGSFISEWWRYMRRNPKIKSKASRSRSMRSAANSAKKNIELQLTEPLLPT